MSPTVSTNLHGRFAATTCFALLMIASTAMADAQNTPAAPVIDKLQQQVTALEKRVAELEKKTVVAVRDQADAEASARKLEQRIANVEKQQESAKSDKTANQNHTEADKSLTVTAPFLVVDSSGKPLMRVGEDNGTFSRGIYVYNKDSSSVAHVGAMVDGRGRVYVSVPNKTPAAMMIAGSDGGSFSVSDDAKTFMSIDREALTYYNNSKTPVAMFGTKARSKGYLELNDSGGYKMVEAGSLDSHKGYVLTSPYTTSVTPQGNPSVLMGGSKK